MYWIGFKEPSQKIYILSDPYNSADETLEERNSYKSMGYDVTVWSFAETREEAEVELKKAHRLN